MKLDGKNILVTGGAGFIGSHLIDELLKTDVRKIVVMDNLRRGSIGNLEQALKDDRVMFLEKDNDITVSDNLIKATKSIDGVFHMASLCLAHCQDDPRLGFETNVLGSFNLFDACAKNNVKRIVFSSSSSVYGNAVYSPMDESHPFVNKNFYGSTKICGESLLSAFYYKHDLSYVNLRYMNVYGPRQDYLGTYVAVIIKIIDSLQRNEPPVIYGDGSQSFDFVYVKDACKANILAFESDLTNENYNISSGSKISVLELCRTIMNLMNSNLEIRFVKNHDRTLVFDRIGSTEKAARELLFEAETSLRDGLLKTIEWKKIA